jgi:hypothetical protein
MDLQRLRIFVRSGEATAPDLSNKNPAWFRPGAVGAIHEFQFPE